MDSEFEIDRLGLSFGASACAEAVTWLEQLPRLLRSVREEWALTLGRPYPGGSGAWVAPVELPDGERAVLKVGFPHREAWTEADGLRLWDGNGAVRLLRHDAARTAFLLEPCDPGAKLTDAASLPAEERLRIGASLLRRLWLPAAAAAGTPIEPVAAQMGWWADMAEERLPLLPAEADRGLVRGGLDLLRSLPESAAHSVLLHGDFNPGNVLSAARSPWLAIDAKPLIGDPAFDPWPLLEQVDPPFAADRPAAVFVSRARLLGDELALEPARILAWGVAKRAESAVAYAAAGDPAACLRILRTEVRTLADLAGL